ncbi:zinc-finger homeodomain protein 4-like [Macadamia integrifolia]|uniref:zinc-finger homeodomain protein 4-like n=1 Tax=Macadamia integrifolia TaxID=60698 RepID=UPI001C4FC4B2|nr:zinc-finger homeodomain protein 4-like [Macadamia integrifolia]
MNLSSQEEEIPIPITTSYAGGHINHIIPSSSPQLPSNGPITPALEDHMPYKKVVRYRECLKNHAAAMGGNATDGCGEFMPSGEEGTLEALKCSACNCHRNFHRKEIEGEPSSCDCYHHPHLNRVGMGMGLGRKLILGPSPHKVGGILGPAEALGYHAGAFRAAQAPPHQMIMSLPSESDEQEGGGGIVPRPPQLVEKRFRTKFTQEQKEKMLSFAEKVGWRMQKQEESVVQQFCQEIGVKRRVLKVWMHNNKHNLAKKNAAAVS